MTPPLPSGCSSAPASTQVTISMSWRRCGEAAAKGGAVFVDHAQRSEAHPVGSWYLANEMLWERSTQPSLAWPRSAAWPLSRKAGTIQVTRSKIPNMPLTLDTLTILDAIERRGSFARAAEELARTPSSLTYAVQQIEAGPDVLLFDRSHRIRVLRGAAASAGARSKTAQPGRHRADREVAAGRLAACEWAGGNPRETQHLAWRSGEAGADLGMVDAGAVAARCAGGGARCRLSPSR